MMEKIAGVDFTNVLHKAFMHEIPKAQKYYQVISVFLHFWDLHLLLVKQWRKFLRSISPMFYAKLLCMQISKAQKTLKRLSICAFGICSRKNFV